MWVFVCTGVILRVVYFPEILLVLLLGLIIIMFIVSLGWVVDCCFWVCFGLVTGWFCIDCGFLLVIRLLVLRICLG